MGSRSVAASPSARGAIEAASTICSPPSGRRPDALPPPTFLRSGALTADQSGDELLSMPEGGDLYAYVVSCALPAGTDGRRFPARPAPFALSEHSWEASQEDS